MIDKFDDIVKSTLFWTLPKYHGSVNEMVNDIQQSQKEDDYVKFYENNAPDKMPYDILVEYSRDHI